MGDRNALIVANLPLVGYLVTEVWSRATHLSREDLAAAGMVALVTAADAYDPTLGVPFGAYARRRIVGAFADEMRAADWASRAVRRRIKETDAAVDALRAALGREPSVEEVASALGVDRAAAVEALSDASRTVVPMDDTIAEIIGSNLSSPEQSILEAERRSYLAAAVAALPEKMRYIVEQIYFAERSVTELAEELGSTHSAVSQQRSEAIRLLRDGLRVHYADHEEEVVLESRVSPARRNAYLAALADLATAGMAQAAADSPQQSQVARPA